MDVPFVYRAYDEASGAPMEQAAPRQGRAVRQTGAAGAVSPLDIHQGALGDCFLLSAIGEIARAAPGAIQSMIQSDGPGTETVTLYEDADGSPIGLDTTDFTPIEVTIHNDFATDGVNSVTNPGAAGGLAAIWPQVIEEAYANLGGGYDSIRNGGYDLVALETLTGKIARYIPVDSAHLNRLKALSSGSLVEFDTPERSDLGYGLIGNHAYMFDGLVQTGRGTKVQLLNPWGTDEPALIPWAQVAHNFLGLTIGHV